MPYLIRIAYHKKHKRPPGDTEGVCAQKGPKVLPIGFYTEVTGTCTLLPAASVNVMDALPGSTRETMKSSGADAEGAATVATAGDELAAVTAPDAPVIDTDCVGLVAFTKALVGLATSEPAAVGVEAPVRIAVIASTAATCEVKSPDALETAAFAAAAAAAMDALRSARDFAMESPRERKKRNNASIIPPIIRL
jgi:hypothetical protein